MEGIFNHRPLFRLDIPHQLIGILSGLMRSMDVALLYTAVESQMLVQKVNANVSTLDVHLLQFFACFLEAAGGIQALDITQVDKGTVLFALFQNLLHDFCVLRSIAVFLL